MKRKVISSTLVACCSFLDAKSLQTINLVFFFLFSFGGEMVYLLITAFSASLSLLKGSVVSERSRDATLTIHEVSLEHRHSRLYVSR